MGIEVFNSYEELCASVNTDRERADADVRASQTAIKVGDFVIRSEEGLLIYSEIMDPVEAERAAGANEGEIEYMRATYAQEHMRNYRFGRHFSEVCPEGEIGDLHIVSVAAILTREAFEEFKAQGWPCDLVAVRTIGQTLGLVPLT